jgi:hypothetical protein
MGGILGPRFVFLALAGIALFPLARNPYSLASWW